MASDVHESPPVPYEVLQSDNPGGCGCVEYRRGLGWRGIRLTAQLASGYAVIHAYATPPRFQVLLQSLKARS